MSRFLKRWLVLITGWLFLLLGVAGLFLPVLQGILFIMIGLAILSSEYAWANHWLGKVRTRFPRLSNKADQSVKQVWAWMQRVFGHKQ